MNTILKAFINVLEIEFLKNAKPGIALEQKAYMRNQLEYYGLKSGERREIQKPFLTAKLMGEYFKKFPEQRAIYVKKWIDSNNIWLQRRALLFQLKYKENLDTALLGSTISSLLGSKEFFINKAIGWILREYSKTNPNWVMEFACKSALGNLSKKEALRWIG